MKPKIHVAIASVLSFLTATNAFSFCFNEAGERYGVNPMVLRSIANAESNSNPSAVHKNSNGTYDVGLMQINTIWKPTLGEERWRYLGDACYNTKTGAWILAGCFRKYGYTWQAIGCYNSQTPEKSEAYAKRVFNQLELLKKGKAPQPLDTEVETAIVKQINEMMAESGPDAILKKKKVIKFVPYQKLPKEKLLQPPEPPPGEPSAPVPLAWGEKAGLDQQKRQP